MQRRYIRVYRYALPGGFSYQHPRLRVIVADMESDYEPNNAHKHSEKKHPNEWIHRGRVYREQWYNFSPMQLPTHIRKVLAVFPHPDDEVFVAGGLLHQCSTHNIQTTLAIFTKGEKGTPDASAMTELKKIRSQELKQSAQLLRIKKLIHHDMGDGELEHKKRGLTKKMMELMATVRPHLVITYDLSGLYGHPDHVALSEITTRVVQRYHPHTHLWYATWHPTMFRLLQLPVHMARDPSFISRRTKPNRHIWIGNHVTHKFKAAQAHKSQRLPHHLTLIPWEFFYEVQ